MGEEPLFSEGKPSFGERGRGRRGGRKSLLGEEEHFLGERGGTAFLGEGTFLGENPLSAVVRREGVGETDVFFCLAKPLLESENFFVGWEKPFSGEETTPSFWQGEPLLGEEDREEGNPFVGGRITLWGGKGESGESRVKNLSVFGSPFCLGNPFFSNPLFFSNNLFWRNPFFLDGNPFG